MKGKLVYLFLSLSLAGCVTYGRDFPIFPVKSIQPNVTTQRDVFGYFGEPIRKGLDSGRETWTYSHHTYALGEGWKTKELYVVFNDDGTVRNYSFTSN